MKLSEYMKLKGLTDERMAAELGKDRSIVSKYRSGTVTPPLTVIAEIEKITDSAVSFHDFLPSTKDSDTLT
jgi:transcriptional regulator with XRE-family HTH domain